jgi:RHS repeat-associated protein
MATAMLFEKKNKLNHLFEPVIPHSHLTSRHGNNTVHEYNNQYHKIRTIRPENQVIGFTPNAYGDVVAQDNPGPNDIVRIYDERRRLTSETNGANETTQYEYDGNNNRTAVIKPEGNRWEYDYDVANRLTSVKNIPESITTSYTYDAADNLKTITDAENKVTTFDYDDRNRKTSKTYPGETAVIDYDYDANSNLTDIDLPNGTHTTYTYDDLNRQTNQSYTGTYGDASVDFTLDGNGNIEQVDEMIDGNSHVYTMVYDDLDRITRQTDRYGNSFDYSYDANGNRKVFKDHTNQLTSYTYDKLNRLKQMTNPNTGAFDWTYNSAGLPEILDYPNGSQATYTYDDANRIDVIDNKQSGVSVTQHDYDYDANGNRIQLTESNIGAAQITSYEYDDADRLVKVYYPTTINSYTLDKVGNRELEVIDTGGVLTTRDYDYNNRDQLKTITDNAGLDVSYDYDAAGNQTEKTENGVTTTFDYTARQRVKSITIGAQSPIEYQYDHAGQRINQQNNGTEKRYLYDGLSLIAETNTLGNTIARYHYGIHHQLAETRNTQSAFYLNDSLGTTVAITNTDGSIQNRMDYDVWGNLNQETATSQSPFGFTGYIKDDETNLYYANARYYDSFTGRFLREDPLFGNTNEPPSLHRYLYGYGNPTFYVDPDGRLAEAGHFYIPLYIALRSGMSINDSLRFAFFVQVGDEIDDLDATSVALDTITAPSGAGLAEAELYGKFPEQKDVFDARLSGEFHEKMKIVQQVFHGITGKDSEEELALTKTLIKNTNDNDLIAFLVHRLGDQAHQDYDKNFSGKAYNLGKQFKTGPGHASKGHEPDSLHFREDLTFSYINDLAGVLGGMQGMSNTEIVDFQKQIVKDLSVLKSIEKGRSNPNNPFRNRKPGFRERAKLSSVLPYIKSIEQLELEDIQILKQMIKKQGLDSNYNPENLPGVGVLKSYAPGYRVKSFDQAADDFHQATGIRINGSDIRKKALQVINLWKKQTDYNQAKAAFLKEGSDNEVTFSIEGY